MKSAGKAATSYYSALPTHSTLVVYLHPCDVLRSYLLDWEKATERSVYSEVWVSTTTRQKHCTLG